MLDAYLGQIETFAFGLAPKGWAPCDGRLLPINQNVALFSLLGTTFGGDGRSTFALPDLRSRSPIGQTTDEGQTPRPLGMTSGEESHTLTVEETTFHGHTHAVVTNPTNIQQNTTMPGGGVGLSKAIASDAEGHPVTIDIYVWDFDPVTKKVLNLPKVPMADAAVGMTGGEPHPNLMPYLALNPCIALQGPMPSPS